MNFKNKNKTGFMLLEIIIAISIITIAFVALLGVVFSAINISNSIQKETQANSLITEELEAVRNFRDGTQWATNGLGIVSTGSSNPYHLVNNANTWTIAAGAETAGIFTRKIVFDKVSRDSNQNIQAVYDSSKDDSDTRKITATISWLGKTIQDVEYLTNWKQ